MSEKNKIAENIGGVFAHLQSTFDEVFGLVFSKLSDGKKPPKEAGKIKKMAYKTGGFFGDIGKSYYEKYEQIKKEK